MQISHTLTFAAYQKLETLKLSENDDRFTTARKFTFGVLAYSVLQIAALIEFAVSFVLFTLGKTIDFFIPKQYSACSAKFLAPIANHFIYSMKTITLPLVRIVSYFALLHFNGYHVTKKEEAKA